MKFEPQSIPDVMLLTPKKFGDDRGYFMETFKANAFNDAIGREVVFVQDNHSFSRDVSTVRGLHFQSPPHAQGKLVRCPKGRILDVAVDIRLGSPSFGQYVSAELSGENAQQLWVPAGFLHGFMTLEPDTEVSYKCTDYYAPDCDGNVRWDDPEIGIDWGVPSSMVVLSAKDKVAPLLKDFNSPFKY